MNRQSYTDFARYYDYLGWSRFAHICADRLYAFVRFRGTGKETVLDLACGTGELENRLKQTNLKFTGVDLSLSMLTQARRKNTGAEFIHGDITNIRLKRKFDLVVCFFDSVNHLSGITAFKNMLRTVRLHLNRKGYFLFDMLSPDGLAGWETVDIRRENDYTVIVNGHYNPDKLKAEISIEGFVRSRRKTYHRFFEKITECSFAFKDVARALALTGFREISVTSFNPEIPVEDANRWFFIVK